MTGSTALAIRRAELPGGITLLGHERSVTPAVVLRASVQAGSMFDPSGKDGLGHFTARMLQRGTRQHTFQQISELTDRVGASLNVDSLEHSMLVSARGLTDDLDLVLGLLAEVLREPIFPPEEIEKLRGQVLTNLKEQNDDTGTTVERRFRELAYPADHPYHRWPMGDEASVASFTRDDFAGFHRRHVQPNRLTIVYSGGVGFDELAEKITRVFDGWTNTSPATPLVIPDVVPPSGVIRRDVGLPGKTQSDVGLGRPSLRRSNPDFYALRMADLILGGLGLFGRLGTSVRDQQGLAYYVYSSVDGSIGPGPWEVRAGVSPANVERAIASIFEEVARIRTQPVDPDELADAKSYLTGILPLGLETNDGVVRTLLNLETFDLGLDYLDRYPSIINSLTFAQVQAAAERYFSTDQVMVVTAGPG